HRRRNFHRLRCDSLRNGPRHRRRKRYHHALRVAADRGSAFEALKPAVEAKKLRARCRELSQKARSGKRADHEKAIHARSSRKGRARKNLIKSGSFTRNIE